MTSVISALGFIIIPISCFCILFSEELIRAAFERGAFDVSATSLTAGVFAGYCVGMFFQGVASVVTNIFYSFGDTRTTMNISIVQIVINVALNLLFIRLWGVAGLAYATSASAILCLCIRFFFLRKYLRIDYWQTLKENLVILALSLFSCFLPYLLLERLTHLNVFVLLILSALMFGLVYLALAYVCKLKTLSFVRDLIKKRLKRN